MNADGYKRGRLDSGKLDGYVTTDRALRLVTLVIHPLMVTYTEAQITAVKEGKGELELILSGNSGKTNRIDLNSAEEIRQVMLNDEETSVRRKGETYTLDLNLHTDSNNLLISF